MIERKKDSSLHPEVSGLRY